MGTIYIDLLVIINLYITFFLLRATAAFLHRKVSTRRILAGSFAGGVSSLIILLPPLPFLLNILVKVVTGSLIVLIVFGCKSRREFLKNALIFIIINIVFAGFTLLLWFFAAPLGMEFNNSVVYFDISFVALIVTTALAYGLIRILRYILDVKHAAERTYKVRISIGGVTVTLDAVADSGNLLTDYFSGLFVIIVPQATLGVRVEDLGLPRLLPYNTIDSSGLIPAFRAQEIVIQSDNMPDKAVNALVGITESDSGALNETANTPAIFNPKLLI